MKPDTKTLKAGIPAGRKKEAGSLKNAGYTLLELIVVVAMLAVGMTIVWMSVSTIFSLEMKQCVKDISSELGKVKVASMTRTGDVYMLLYKNSDGIYIDKYENNILTEQHIKVGSAKMTVEYYSDLNTAGTPLDTNGIIVAFNKNNGSFKTIEEAWELHDVTYSPSNAYYSKIVVSGGNSSRTIVLWPDTGKFSIK